MAHKSKAFTIDDFLARSGAGESSIRHYGEELRRMEGKLGVPLASASARSLERLKKKLRKQASGPQRALFLRMFYKAAGRPDLVELMRLKQRLRRLSPDEILTLPEVNKLIAAANSLRDRAMIALLWETGARIHEVCALTLGNVKQFSSKENGGTIHLRVFFPKVKVPGEEHASYLIESVSHMKAWIRAHLNPRPDAPLFPSARGTILSRHRAEKIIRRTAEHAAIGKRTYPQLFRHSRATHLLRLNVPEAMVKKLLGWKPNSPMIARYSHLVDRDAYAALLRASGLEPPEVPKEGALVAAEGELQPVVPMVLGPHAKSSIPAGLTPEIEEHIAQAIEQFIGERLGGMIVKAGFLKMALDDPAAEDRIREIIAEMNGRSKPK